MLGPDDLETEVDGEVEKDDGVLVLRRVHAVFRVRLPASNHDVAERVAELAITHCPVARSIGGSVRITTAVEYLSP